MVSTPLSRLLTIILLVGIPLSMPSSKALQEPGICLSDSQLLLEIEPVGDISITSEARVSEAIADLNTLIEASGVSNSSVTALGINHLLFSTSDPTEDLPDLEHLLHSSVQLEFRLQKPDTDEQLDAELQALSDLRDDRSLAGSQRNAAWKNSDAIQQHQAAIAELFEAPMVTHEDVTYAEAQPSIPAYLVDESAESGEVLVPWGITIYLDEDGQARFTEMTRQAARSGLAIGVFINRELVSASYVDTSYAETGLQTGKGYVSLDYDSTGAQNLARQLRLNALAVITSEQVANSSNCLL